jgi:hypothetical protein
MTLAAMTILRPRQSRPQQSVQERTYQPERGTLVAMIQDEAINECSGLVRSIQNQDCFWTHNDSGDTPRLFLVGKDGNTRARLHVTGARAIDWEDIAIGTVYGKPMLVVGDIGGNANPRDDLILYFVEEPIVAPKLSSEDLADSKTNATLDLQQTFFLSLRVRVPGGVTNYESIAFDASDASILLVEKAILGSRVYRIQLPDEKTFAKVREYDTDATLIERSAVPTATACDVSSDGTKLLIITYQVGFLYERQTQATGVLETWKEALSREPVYFPLPRLAQTEAACFSEDGMSIYVASEGIHSPIVQASLKELCDAINQQEHP